MGTGDDRATSPPRRSPTRRRSRREVLGLGLLVAFTCQLLTLLVFTWSGSDAALPAAAAPTPAPRVPLPSPTSGSGPLAVSPNWAGVVLDAGDVTAVRARWAVPRIPSPGRTGVAVWVGVGGFGDASDNLIQIGTVSQQEAGGAPTAGAWWETLPSPGGWHHLDIHLSPGDTVAVSMEQVGPQGWILRCSDLESGAAVSITTAYRSAGRYADWIVEDPEELLGTYPAGYADLADFGSVKVRGAAAVVAGQTAGPASPGAMQVVMGRDGATYAAPTAPDAAGSFSVRRVPA